jgi:Spy/CpxP family protein refolding chaperone
MDLFTQKKLLIRVIILLAFLNLFSISIFLWKEFFHKPPRPDEKRDNREVSSVLKKELNLSDKQIEQVNELRTSYFDKEKILEKTIREERDSMNEAMFNKATEEDLVKSLARKVAENEYQMELLRFQQAKDFKALCTEEQLKKFGGLVKEIRDYLKPDNQQKKK